MNQSALYSVVTLTIFQCLLVQATWIPLPGFGTVPTTTTTTTTTRPPTVAPTVAPTAAPTAAPGVNDALNTGFGARVNAYRGLHGVAPLVFSADLQTKAKACAENYASAAPTLCGEYYDYVESWEGKLTDLNTLGGDLAYKWNDEGEDFSYEPIAYVDAKLRFTQLVWKATKTYGCATSDQTVDTVFISCVFDPPGNVETIKGSSTVPLTAPIDSLKANVLPLI